MIRTVFTVACEMIDVKVIEVIVILIALGNSTSASKKSTIGKKCTKDNTNMKNSDNSSISNTCHDTNYHRSSCSRFFSRL